MNLSGPAPTESAMLEALRGVLAAALPLNVGIYKTQVNRVPEPREDNFVMMTPILDVRLSTNTHTYLDVKFVASIAGAVMTVSSVAMGVLLIGADLSGLGVATGSTIVAQLTGTPGGIGTYTILPTQNLTSRIIAAGGNVVTAPQSVTVQLDVHGQFSSDNAKRIMTLLRDEWGTRKFEELGDVAVPLYTSDPRQLPFINGEQQYETRWVVDVVLQLNDAIRVPQEFADVLDPTLIEVEARFPA